MDLGEKDKFGLEKRGEGHLNYHSSGISSDWQFGNPPSLGLVSANPSMPDCQGNQMDSSSCQPASMVDSFCPNLWGQPPSSQNLSGFSESNVGRPIPGPSRLDMVWNPQAPMQKNGGMFSHNAAGILPPGLSQFPADLAFIERAARFSCFGGGSSSYSNMTSPFNIGESLSPFSNSSKAAVSGALSQQTDASMGEGSKDAARRGADQGSNGGSPMNSQNGASASEHGEAELSGGGQEVNPSSQVLAAKKRKKNSQMDIDQDKEESSEPVEAINEKTEAKQKSGQSNSTSGANGKNAKDDTESPKEDYIHVRARRGQATNSHSLAERVRREKISERMKFLQDLVPGCNKVTGKAVMLDEIINYVQSLQRQVEFLSMKLAAVNPQLEFNVEGLLSKDVLSSRSGPSSTIGFSAEMAHPLLHPTQQALIQSGLSSMGTPPSDALRRAVNAQFTAMNTYKEVKRQMPNAWDDEFSNVISQMGFSTSAPLNIQDLSGKARDGFPL